MKLENSVCLVNLVGCHDGAPACPLDNHVGGVSPVPLASFAYDRQNKTARHSEQQGGGGGIGCLVTPLWILIVDRKN